mmetsp:Transcript_26003/g.88852  ORF Transcript_26003/g.88852 Transcript_26003/m.88852 type:complete len:258 (+) Transcript_26003:201-974(+)
MAEPGHRGPHGVQRVHLDEHHRRRVHLRRLGRLEHQSRPRDGFDGRRGDAHGVPRGLGRGPLPPLGRDPRGRRVHPPRRAALRRGRRRRGRGRRPVQGRVLRADLRRLRPVRRVAGHLQRAGAGAPRRQRADGPAVQVLQLALRLVHRALALGTRDLGRLLRGQGQRLEHGSITGPHVPRPSARGARGPPVLPLPRRQGARLRERRRAGPARVRFFRNAERRLRVADRRRGLEGGRTPEGGRGPRRRARTPRRRRRK